MTAPRPATTPPAARSRLAPAATVRPPAGASAGSGREAEPAANLWPELPSRAASGLPDDVGRLLLARRMVLLHGTIDEALAAQSAATLMTLDAAGDERVLLRLTGAEANVDVALVLMDVIGVLGVPVDAVAAGTLTGGAVGVLAACRHRSMAPHARLCLREPDGAVAGRALDIERALAALTSQRNRFFGCVAAATGRPQTEVEQCWAASRFLAPQDAVVLGYADEVEQASPGREAPGR